LAYRLANDSTQSDEALKYAQAALEIGPDNPAIQDTIGWAYYRKGLYKNALPYLTSASASGKVPVRLYHLAMLYAQLGDQKKARQTFDTAVHLNSAIPEAKLAQDLLARTPSTSR
jgi:tetratricopeptide (TPR) repeat protein